MKHVLLAGICLIMPAVCGCQWNKDPESSSLSQDYIVEAAHATYAVYVHAMQGVTHGPTKEIDSKYWADGIKALKPIKVYVHMVNIVVVQRIRDGSEEGKYVCIPVSSYLPMTGDDGFVFTPEPLSGSSYNLSNGVFDFKRTTSR